MDLSAPSATAPTPASPSRLRSRTPITARDIWDEDLWRGRPSSRTPSPPVPTRKDPVGPVTDLLASMVIGPEAKTASPPTALPGIMSKASGSIARPEQKTESKSLPSDAVPKQPVKTEKAESPPRSAPKLGRRATSSKLSPRERPKKEARAVSISTPASSSQMPPAQMESKSLPSEAKAEPKTVPPPRALPYPGPVETKAKINVENVPKKATKPPPPKRAPPLRQATTQDENRTRSPTPEPRSRRAPGTPNTLPSFSESPRNEVRRARAAASKPSMTSVPSMTSMPSTPSIPKDSSAARSRTPPHILAATRDLIALSAQLTVHASQVQDILEVNNQVSTQEINDLLEALRGARDAMSSFSRRQLHLLRGIPK